MHASRRPIQLHLSSCVLLSFVSSLLLLLYLEFSKLSTLYEPLAGSSLMGAMMQCSYIAFSVSILIGAAFVSEKWIGENTPQPVRIRARSHRTHYSFFATPAKPHLDTRRNRHHPSYESTYRP